MNTKYKLLATCLLLASANALACMTIYPRFKAADTSFSKSELSLGKNSNGLVFTFEGDEFYFNYAKGKWCTMPETHFNDLDLGKKQKETCLEKGKNYSIEDADKKKVANMTLGADEKALIIKSVFPNGEVNNSAPYLRLNSSADYIQPKCFGCNTAGYYDLKDAELNVEYIKKSKTEGFASVAGGNFLTMHSVYGDVKDNAPRMRSISFQPVDAKSDSDSGIDNLSGNEIVSEGKGCGAPRKRPYERISENTTARSGGGKSGNGNQ